jgi:hypothetical protein
LVSRRATITSLIWADLVTITVSFSKWRWKMSEYLRMKNWVGYEDGNRIYSKIV